MSINYILNLAAGSLDPRNATFATTTTTAAAAAPTANQIILYRGDSVSTRRKLEMVNTWKWLHLGINERNLMDRTVANGGWAGGIVCTAVNLNKRSIPDRRTNSTVVGVTFSETNDLMLGLGAGVTTAGTSCVNELKSCIARLCDYARETNLRKL
jgi:hypothetical protein